MSALPKSRWADTEADAQAELKRKAEREAKKAIKASRRAQLDAETKRREEERIAASAAPNGDDVQTERPLKRRKVSLEPEGEEDLPEPVQLLRFPAPQIAPCRHVDNFERLNHIEEGSYGWVSRARETATGEIVALKKLKMENAQEGFPVTGLREIQTLKASKHKNIIELREVVIGDTLDDVFLVMPFYEHDLKTLSENMTDPFLPSETKTLLAQLVSGVAYLHSHWILHRDLKTSNLLLNNRGQLKLADFGMARYAGDPPPKLTQLVVTLWYRAPELLLGAETYGREVDLWSVGCIFAELLARDPVLQGKNEVDQVTKIFALCGIPTLESWPGFKRLPNARSLRLPPTPANAASPLRAKFSSLTNAGTDLLTALLALNPARRPSAEEVLRHPYFAEDPKPKSAALFPTFPSKAGQEKRYRVRSPNAPKRGDAPGLGTQDFANIFGGRENEEAGGGFSLRLV